ncbi:fatty acid alpha-hydroxylase [Xanthoria parietina]
MSSQTLPNFTSSEVHASNTSNRCWVTIGSKVYNVTGFVDAHPGGGELILQYGGQDVGDIMQDEISHLHSESAYDILDENLIGYVASDPVLNAAVNSDRPQNILPLPPNQAGAHELRMNGAAEHVPTERAYETTSMVSEEHLCRETNAAADYRKHGFLKLDEPLLMQVWNGGFTKDFYLGEVHRARQYNGDGSAPLFGNFLEPLSKTAWWVVPLVWLPWVSFGSWLAYGGIPSSFQFAAYWITGLCLWSLVEYGLHRGLFHIDKYLPDNRVGITAHFLLHGIHHFLPMDKYRLVMPPTLFVVLAAPFWKLAHTVFYWDWYVATAVFCGGIFGYVCYDCTHYFLHHKKIPTAYHRALRSYHIAHHYTDSGNGFGVTSRFWDRVFGTELPMSKPIKAS